MPLMTAAGKTTRATTAVQPSTGLCNPKNPSGLGIATIAARPSPQANG